MIIDWLLGLVCSMIEWGCGVINNAWSSVTATLHADALGWFVARLDGWLPVADIVAMVGIVGTVMMFMLVWRVVKFVMERVVV